MGYTSHCTQKRESYLTTDGNIPTTKGDSMKTKGIGTGVLICAVSHEISANAVHDVRYLPDFQCENREFLVQKNNEVYFEAFKSNSVSKVHKKPTQNNPREKSSSTIALHTDIQKRSLSYKVCYKYQGESM